MNIDEIRKDFPILNSGVIYFDNACTTLKPIQVMNAMNRYYVEYPGCAGRSMHSIGKKAEEETENARRNIAKFVNAFEEELVFTKNATESLNLVASSIRFPEGKNNIVTTIMEHHSNYLPFHERCIRNGTTLRLVDDASSMERWEEQIGNDTGLVALHSVSNTLGESPPVEKIVKLAHDHGALVLVDGAQSVPHLPADFKKSNIDFLAFSGHKMLGPTGIGCLVAKKSAMEQLDNFIVGGGTVEHVKADRVTYLKTQKRLEGGIQNYSGIIGLSAAVDYLKKISMSNIESHEQILVREIEKLAGEIENLVVYGNFKNKKSAVFTFNVKGVEPHQVAITFDRMAKICTRSGVFCAQPAMEYIGAPSGAVRASLYLYNSQEEFDKFFRTLDDISKTLGG